MLSSPTTHMIWDYAIFLHFKILLQTTEHLNLLMQFDTWVLKAYLFFINEAHKELKDRITHQSFIPKALKIS